MKTAIVVLAFLTCACGVDDTTIETTLTITIADNVSGVTQEDIRREIDLFLVYETFETRRVTVTVDADSDEQFCGSLSDACTRHASNDESRRSSIYVPWPAQHPVFARAELLAHELCHAYYYVTKGDGDGNHTHHECFARETGEYAAYQGEIGIATLVAEDFSRE